MTFGIRFPFLINGSNKKTHHRDTEATERSNLSKQQKPKQPDSFPPRGSQIKFTQTSEEAEIAEKTPIYR
jgi:hypothetical protein